MNEENDSGAEAETERLAFGPFVLTMRPLALARDGLEVPLRHQALRLLCLFVQRGGRLVDHDEIRRHVWGERYVDHARGTHLLIGEIRQALGDHARDPRYLETIPRQGYRFLAPVSHGRAAGRRRTRRMLRHRRTRAAAAGIVASGALLLWSGWHDAVKPPAEASAAKAAYAKAMHLVERRTPEALRHAEAYLADALRLDPAFADAQAGLARVARLEGDLDAADAGARAALALDPDSARAHLEMGVVRALRDWDWAGAARHLGRAAAADTAGADAHAAQAALLTVLGRHREALEASRRAYAADPVSALVRADHGWFHYYAGEFETAWRLCGEAGTLTAAPATALLCQYKAASMSGDDARALAAAGRLVERWRADEPGERGLEHVPTSLDAFSCMRRVRLERLRAANQAPPEAFATAYAEIGDLEMALEMLEAAFEQRSAGLPLALRDPVLVPLRGEPRFQRLVRDTLPAAIEQASSSHLHAGRLARAPD